MSILNNTSSLQAILEKAIALPAAAENAPNITVDSSGLITATAGSKTSTHQLAFQAAKTITPSSVDQTAVSSGCYTGGDIIVKGDSNLIAENIVKDISVFGVIGTHNCAESVKTCTIKITDNIGVNGGVIIAMTTIEDGVATANRCPNEPNSTVTIENVVCGSSVCVIYNELTYSGVGTLNVSN